MIVAAVKGAPPTPVRCDPSRTALIVIDLQRQFIEDASPLHVTGSSDLLAGIGRLAADLRSRAGLVVWVAQQRRANVAHSATSTRYGIEGAHSGTGADLDPRLPIDAGSDEILIKPRQSAFYSTDLELLLRSRGIERVLLAGVTTNVCVLATAKDAAERDLAVHVLADLTAALPVRLADGTVVMDAAAVHQAALMFSHWAHGDVTTSTLVAWSTDSSTGREDPEDDDDVRKERA